jgi:Ni/Co efflux regulator RcnB
MHSFRALCVANENEQGINQPFAKVLFNPVVLADRQTDRQTDRQADGETDRQTDRQTDSRQTDRQQSHYYSFRQRGVVLPSIHREAQLVVAIYMLIPLPMHNNSCTRCIPSVLR